MSVIVTTTLNPAPSSAYLWLPETVKLPPLPLIVALVSSGLPSPQSMVAEYSAAVARVLGSVNVATVPLKICPSVEEIVVGAAVIGCSLGPRC
jgi:precorrin-3B methylase